MRLKFRQSKEKEFLKNEKKTKGERFTIDSLVVNFATYRFELIKLIKKLKEKINRFLSKFRK